MKLKRFTTQLMAAGLIALPMLASAAGLGKLSVTSALGQPLVAEIELFAADQAELDSLSASLASDQAFRDARVEFAPVLSSLRFTVEKKPNGKAVLKVVSTRPVNDPFIDMLVELNWASGRLVREYTMLLDPPGMAVAQTVSPVVVTPQPAASEPDPASVFAIAPETAPEPVAEPAPVSAPEVVAVAEPVPEVVPEAAPEAVAEAAAEVVAASEPEAGAGPSSQPAPQDLAGAPDSVAVKRGDTLTGIAQRVRPEGVSLEQTLLGLYRENAAAFDGNMNRLKAGKTLEVPSAEKVAAISQKEAVRELKLQAADWRAYRQKLAAAVSDAPEAQPASGQTSSGKITPKVEDRATSAAAPKQDVLKLSKAASPADGAVSSATAEENRVLQEKLRAMEEDAAAREKSLRESGQRVAMLEKQIQDMQKLAQMRDAAQSEAPAAVVPAPVPAPAAAPVSGQESEDALETAAEPAPEAEAPKPALAMAAPAVVAPQTSPVPADNWYDPLLADPMYWGGGLAAIGLGGVLWWMMAGSSRRRRSGASALDDSTLSTSDAHPVSQGGASGGSVNTGDSSFLTDFSQAGLGTIDTHDVDPIAEAEVYMAYGRDAQAEEILNEAIAKNPDRHEVRVKLLEILAARRNAAAFEFAAGELYAALGSKPSPLWDKACEMGRAIDPTNPLYGGAQSSAAPAAATVAATAAVAGGAVTFADEPKPEPKPEPVFEPVMDNGPLDFESMGDVLEFDTAFPAATTPGKDVEEVDTQEIKFELPDLDLPASTDDAMKLDFGFESKSEPENKFDFSSFDIELADSAEGEFALDEVGTKLDLARAYVEMGDKEGALEILGEVLAEGSDTQKADAKALMNSLG